jgi:hypothetical protein
MSLAAAFVHPHNPITPRTMKSPPRPSLLRPSLALVGTLLALAGVCRAQTPQVLVYDGGPEDRGVAVTTDATGSIIVGGYSGSGMNDTFAVLKYNAAGTLQWLARAQGLADTYAGYLVSDVLTDAAGNVYAVGSAAKALPFLQYDLGWLVAGYTPAGAQRWIQLTNGAGNSRDLAYCAAFHPQQGLYVTGVTADAFGRADWLTIKYSADGVEQWRRIEPGVGNTDDQPIAVKVDAAGNAVVAGYVQTADIGSPRDIRVIKYDPAGNVLWRADYSDTAISDEFPNDMAIDAAGNVYVVADRGVSTNPELTTNPITIKFDANGNRLFVLAGPGQGGSAIALDAAGNFVVSGSYNESNGSNHIVQTSKFTPNGTMLWSHPIVTSNLSVDELDGSVYLARNFSYTILKLNSAGVLQWEQSFPPGSRTNDSLVDAATGALVVTGHTTSTGGDIVTVRVAAGSTPPPPPPPMLNAPSGLSASAKKGSIALAWTDNSNNESGFRIERSANGGAFVQIAQVGANVRSFNNTGLTKGVTYAYRVRAFNANGASAYSNTASGVPR